MGKTATAPLASPPSLALPTVGMADDFAPITPSPVGNGGQTSFSISLPISPGRGYAPSLSLSSGPGNGVFGWGWHAGAPTIRRRTDRGVPNYDSSDEFVGPDGEVLVLDAATPPTTGVDTYGGGSGTPITLDATYTVTRYLPRVDGGFSLVERWQAANDPTKDFWLVHTPDGEVQCYGKTAEGRIADPQDMARIGAWLLQESVNANCQHIVYRYGADVTGRNGCDLRAGRYLWCVYYGNTEAQPYPWYLDSSITRPDWQPALFTLVFDYGQTAGYTTPPPVYASLTTNIGRWVGRPDPDFDFSFGFEVTGNFLCTQVLMFHNVSNNAFQASAAPTLISRLLFDYDHAHPGMSRLTGCQLMAYENDDDETLQCHAPIDIGWSPDFTTSSVVPQWMALEHPLTVPQQGSSPQADQMEYGKQDLYSEGMAGLIHRQGNCWYYRRPVRDTRPGAPANAVTYGARQLLNNVPLVSGSPDSLIADINGDGRLECVMAGESGARGYYYVMRDDRTWSGGLLSTQLPSELGMPYARFADLHGAGLSDLIVLCPTSIRLYVNESTDETLRFSAPIDVQQAAGIVLPVPGRSPVEWVDFVDILGSSQSHLVRVRAHEIECWPWLGNGKFGQPKRIDGPVLAPDDAFAPNRVFWAHIFGSNGPDLVYAEASEIRIYRNTGALGFAPNPMKIPYPDGVHLGSLNSLSLSDEAGSGGLSFVLTQPFGGTNGATRHWRLDLTAAPPNLVTSLDNNMGTSSVVTWRSALQDWLDEKQETPAVPSETPSRGMVVGSLTQKDAFTGLQHVSSMRYRAGIWDGFQRESRGYRYTEMQVQVLNKDGTNVDLVQSGLTKTWFHTGRAQDEDPNSFTGSPYADLSPFPQGMTLLTTFVKTPPDQAPWHDEVCAPSDASAWWMHRSLRGQPLRAEQYAVDGPGVPFSVQSHRWQVRQLQASNDKGCPAVVLPGDLEQLSYVYDQVGEDPLIKQSLVMDRDEYGYTLWALDVSYPRRLTSQSENPYTNLPFPELATTGPTQNSPSWAATFDSQQTLLRLQETRHAVEHGVQREAWRLGALTATRANVLTYSQSPAAGLSWEQLSQGYGSKGLLAPTQERVLQAQSVYSYVGDPQLPPCLKLVSKAEVALLTESDSQMVAQTFGLQVSSAGYAPSPLTLTVPGATETGTIMAGALQLATYTPSGFWPLQRYQASSLAGADGKLPYTTITWDEYSVVALAVTDAYGNTTTAQYDYRFVVPHLIVDANMNTREVQLNAIGKVVATSFHGTQLSLDTPAVVESVHFDSLNDSPVPWSATIDDALQQAASTEQKQATYLVYEPLSAMGNVTRSEVNAAAGDTGSTFDAMVLAQLLLPQGYIRAPGHAWANGQTSNTYGFPTAVRSLLAEASRSPARMLQLTADQWPGNLAQQRQAVVQHYDGLGRAIGHAQLVPDSRWAVGGNVQLTPDGKSIYVWPPVFQDSWNFAGYGALQRNADADIHFFDALGRETRVKTGLNFWRRTSYAPWFDIAEDENDLVGVIDAPSAQILDTSR